MPRAGATTINSGSGGIGDIRHSRLTEAQFQSLNGTGWVLYDNRNIVGSKLNTMFGFTTLDDARGLVLRGKNNGRSTLTGNADGDLALGAFQDHAITAHSHNFNTFGNVPAVTNNPASSGSGAGGTTTTNNGNTAGNETRMRNLTTNIFIKIN